MTCLSLPLSSCGFPGLERIWEADLEACHLFLRGLQLRTPSCSGADIDDLPAAAVYPPTPPCTKEEEDCAMLTALGGRWCPEANLQNSEFTKVTTDVLFTHTQCIIHLNMYEMYTCWRAWEPVYVDYKRLSMEAYFLHINSTLPLRCQTRTACIQIHLRFFLSVLMWCEMWPQIKPACSVSLPTWPERTFSVRTFSHCERLKFCRLQWDEQQRSISVFARRYF